MSEKSIKAIKDAIQAHIEEKLEPGEAPEFLLEFAVGYATMVQDADTERYSYKYIVDPHATPHSSVGLFAMASTQLDIDLDSK